MKLKQRFKKALFAFFKDEILKSVGYEGKRTVFETKGVDFTEIRSEIMISQDHYPMYHQQMPFEYMYEEKLKQARQEIFEKAMDHIIIDERSVMDLGVFPHRAIKVSLFVGKPQK